MTWNYTEGIEEILSKIANDDGDDDGKYLNRSQERGYKNYIPHI
jgi:hypothetical protein